MNTWREDKLNVVNEVQVDLLGKVFCSPAIIMSYNIFKVGQSSHHPVLLVASHKHLEAKRCLEVHWELCSCCLGRNGADVFYI